MLNYTNNIYILKDEWKQMRKDVADHQKEKWLQPVVSPKEYTLDTVGQAHVDIISSTQTSGNIIINTSGS